MAEKKNDPLLQKFNQKILGVHCKNAFKSSLREILSSQVVQQRIQSLGFSTETKELERFFETLRTQYNNVCYGKNSVTTAVDSNAVETLFISDHLFRSTTTEVRKLYVKLSERAEKNGIKVLIFSSETAAGSRLKNMSGIACILRFIFVKHT